jgi:predicted dehydrogenase
MSRSYGVGLIGVAPPASWSVIAHLPALRARPDRFRIAGIANSSAESGAEAAAACGVEHAFASVDALCESPDVDIVTICVRADAHAPLVRKALAAGKHVFCEWPLGCSYAETRELAALAAERNVITVCGSQAVAHPAIRHAASLIAQGWPGDLLFASIVADGRSWGPEVPQRLAYGTEETSGATLLTVPVGHTLVGLQEMFGPIATVFAETSIRRPFTRVIETGERLPVNTPDNAMIGITFASGLPLSMHYRGGTNRGTGFRCEIIGTEGELHLTGPLGLIEMVELTITGARAGDTAMVELPVPQALLPEPRRGAHIDNVMTLYDRMHADLTTGSRTAPDFADAVTNHRVIEAIRLSSKLGRRIAIDEVDGL